MLSWRTSSIRVGERYAYDIIMRSTHIRFGHLLHRCSVRYVVPRRHCIGDESTGRRESEWAEDGRTARGRELTRKTCFTKRQVNIMFFFLFVAERRLVGRYLYHLNTGNVAYNRHRHTHTYIQDRRTTLWNMFVSVRGIYEQL